MIIEQLIFAYFVILAVFVYRVLTTTGEQGQGQSHPLVAKAVKISLILVSILLVVVIALNLTGIYFFGKPNIDASYLVPIKNPLNDNEVMYANIVLSGEVIAAQEQLYAFVTIYPNSTWRENNQIDENAIPADFLLVFDGAQCNNVLPTFELSSACNIRLYYNNGRWTAGNTLSYAGGGEYRIYIADFSANTTRLTTTDDRFIQVESYQVTTEKTNVYVASMIGLASVAAALFLLLKKRG